MSTTAVPIKVRLLAPILRKTRPAWLASFVKRVVGIERVLVQTESGRYRVDPISHFGHSLLRSGAYEPEIAEVLRRYLKPGCTFLDLGANEGFFTILAGRIVGPNGRVVAVEPQSRLCPIIQDNIALNLLKNVQVVQTAIGEKEGSAQLFLAPDVNTGSSGLDRATRYQVDSEPVQVITLNQLFDQTALSHVDLMKIDIEGLEYEVILSSPNLFGTGAIKVLALEIHPDLIRRRGHDPDKLEAALRDYGYRADSITRHGIFVHQ